MSELWLWVDRGNQCLFWETYGNIKVSNVLGFPSTLDTTCMICRAITVLGYQPRSMYVYTRLRVREIGTNQDGPWSS